MLRLAKDVEGKLAFIAYVLLIPSVFLVEGVSGPLLSILGVIGSSYFILKRFGLVKFDFSRSVDGLLGKEDERLNRASKIGIALYIVCLLFLILRSNMTITPDQMLFIGLLGTFLLRREKSFIWDWVPFIALIVAYDAMRGIADMLSGAAHYVELINADKLLFFGVVPTVWLQDTLSATGNPLYTNVAVFFYTTHFLSMMFFAYLLWVVNRGMFSRYKAAIILVSYAGLITFLLYPAAPPWLAAKHGFLPPLKDVITDQTVIPSVYVETIYFHLNANDVAAIPSLHMAYPWIIFLYSLRTWGRKALPVVILPLGVAYGAVYLGHHYVIDLIIGVIYATASYLAVDKVMRE
ncbi:MAG: phosphatase PAP2 family protein [Candidatus Altiarchaeota archaeon]|nr:phosphatase PAP2 family protein [Candidatus Altiarchaeota archaeon]